MRELRGDQHASMATRWHRSLPLQRVRPLLQDERAEPAAHQAQAETGECKNPTNFPFSCYIRPRAQRGGRRSDDEHVQHRRDDEPT